MTTNTTCQSCGAGPMRVFYESQHVPVHSCLLLETHQDARDFPRRDIALGFCRSCGFIQNVIFDPAMLRYSTAYEEQQSFSPRFNAFAEQLAAELVERYGLQCKTIVEIGCGKGDWLELICRLGSSRGIGIDPSYIPERLQADNLSFIQDFYSEKYSYLEGDMIACRHTLEHIPNTLEFMQTIRRSVTDRNQTIVFLEVPDVGRVLREIAFWDIYYEHCSYFTLGSLARLFRKAQFRVLHLAKGFDDQYLLLEAQATKGNADPPLAAEESLEELARDVEFFANNFKQRLCEWRRRIDSLLNRGQRAAIWASGSKCVSFLHSLNIENEVGAIVDVNPYRHGRYLAGSGKRIFPPEYLREYRPDVVIAMNSIYREEIRRDLHRMGLDPALEAL